MTKFGASRNDLPPDTSIPSAGASLESILCTEELQRRPSRPPDHEKENRALVALASALADSGQAILQTLSETILHVTGADSSGVSLLTTDDRGKRFYWPAIAGMWKPHIGGGTPRDFGPCGDVLDCNRALLFRHPERRYPYLLPVMPTAEECLLVPFYLRGKAVGTIWAIMHSDRRKFDAEDERIMNVLGQFASVAYRTLVSIDSLKLLMAAREKAETELRKLTDNLEAQVRARTEELERRNNELAEAETRLAEEKLHLERSEAYLAEAQRLSHTGSWHWNVSTGEVNWSREYCAIFGFNSEKDKPSYQSFIERVHPEDRHKVEHVLWSDVREKRDFDGEYRLLFPDGSIRYLHSLGKCSVGRTGDVEYIGAVVDITERKRAEENLRGSEARKAAILNSAIDCIVTIDHEGRIIEFNPAAESTFGYRRDEVIGRQLADIIIPLSLREKHRRGLARYLATGETQLLGKRVELTAVRADGREIPVELAITRIPLDGPPCFTGYLRDITERRISEGRWKRMFENSAIGIALTTLDGRFEATNSAYRRLCGYTEEELLKMNFLDITVPDLRAHNWALVTKLLEGECDQFNIEKQYRHKDGHLIWVRNNVSLIPGADGVPGYIMAIVEDITDRKHAEEKLRGSEAFLAESQHLSRTGSFSWRVATDDITWSEQLYRIFGFEQGVQVTLDLISTRVHPEDLLLFNDMIGRARSVVSDFDYEHRLLMPDHSVKYLHLIAHGTRDKENVWEYIGAVQDVTQRRSSELALAKARLELSHVAKVTSLGVLTASIAHEVNQPLSGIITNASTCLRMLGADPPNINGARETARRMIRDGNRASEVITRLRALFSKKDTAIESVDLNEATREVIALSMSELQRNRVILRLELADDLPLITGDRVQLQQVILNLLRNASDAMTAIDDRPRRLAIRTRRDEDDHVRLTVQDAGVGFDPQAMDKVFEAFYTTKNDGMGIGLSVSRSIIESHHGRIWATLNDGPGATFSFSIPREPAGFADASGNRVRTLDVTDAA